MTPLFIILLSLALHLLAFGLLIRHLRTERRHHASLRVIGSDPLLTEALHQRLRARQPVADWLNPHAMRARCARWLRTGGQGQ